MFPGKPPRRSPTLLVVLALLLTAACVRRPLSGVSVKNLSSELVFGVPPLPEAVAPANTLPSSIGFLELSDREGSSFSVFRRRSREVEVDPCPAAPPGAAPFESVPQQIGSPPRPGIYNYRYAIEYPKAKVVLDGFEKRGIGNIQRGVDRSDPESARFDFIFTLTQELAATDVQILSATVFGVDQTSQRVNPTGPSVFTGQNPKGLYVLSIEQIVTERGKTVTRKFNANPAIKYMTLPGIIGAEGAFSTTSVDSENQTVITHEGETVYRQPVDVCGEMIDTWFVDAVQRVTGPDGKTTVTKYQYGVATQFGGMLAFEHIEVPMGAPDVIRDFFSASIAPK